MSTISARLDVVRVFGKLTATVEGRRYLKVNGYTPGTPILAAEYGDAIGEVLARMQPYDVESCVVALM